jgi:glutamine synthetase
VAGGPGNPRGGNVEVKAIDPSANPYFASALILGLALHGMETAGTLPPEITVDPASLSGDQRLPVLPTDQAAVISALDNSSLVRGILGDAAVDATVAVRRYEHDTYADLEPAQLADRFRMAWSV